MILSEYLSTNGITLEDFAKSIGVRRQAVHSWCHGRAKPTPRHAKRVEAITDGQITAYELIFGDIENANQKENQRDD